jgi:putative glycosyltransferase (TIGR04372 family)
MTTNHQFFGHLLLEPEKFLSARDSRSELYEIDFTGVKDWKNIGIGDRGRTGSPTLTLWTLGKKKSTVNVYLFKIWRRHIHCVPGFVSGMFIRASRFPSLKNVSQYKFSSLISADRVLDDSSVHLGLNKKELSRAEKAAEEIGISINKPIVCLTVRNKNLIDTDSELRSRDVSDFLPSVELLADSGFQVLRMGATSSPELKSSNPNVWDYANSDARSELLDLYLLSKCSFAISTLTGPDAACMVFRRPVLYVDLANYGLCFSGTSLTTWTPARIIDEETGNALSLKRVFECGAGWFWKDSQFRNAGLVVERSTSEEIATYTQEMILRTNDLFMPNEAQRLIQAKYRDQFASAMGDRGVKWHGQIRSRMNQNFLDTNGDWFLGR